jgi:hypothetical protein
MSMVEQGFAQLAFPSLPLFSPRRFLPNHRRMVAEEEDTVRPSLEILPDLLDRLRAVSELGKLFLGLVGGF